MHDFPRGRGNFKNIWNFQFLLRTSLFFCGWKCCFVSWNKSRIYHHFNRNKLRHATQWFLCFRKSQDPSRVLVGSLHNHEMIPKQSNRLWMRPLCKSWALENTQQYWNWKKIKISHAVWLPALQQQIDASLSQVSLCSTIFKAKLGERQGRSR